jgi:outer membrane lipoprotein-sorting protein
MNRLLTAVMMIFLIPSAAFPISPQEIIENTDRVRAPFESFEMDVAVKDRDSRMEFRVFSKKGENSLVLYLLPIREKGKLLLMKEENLWIYIPGTRRALRITPMQRLMGGVSNGDIARLRWSFDYDARLIGEGERVYHLELKARKKSATYHLLHISVEKGTFKPIKAEVFLKSGKRYKTIFFTGFRTFSGKLMATDLKFIDHLRADRETIMYFTNVREKGFPGKYFNRAELPRLSEILLR